jgi:Trk K+ transport system NAD-binding subunit
MSFKRLRLAAVLVALGIVVGTLGFHFLENADWFTALYWMSAEFTLVGANDFTPHTFWGKTITIVLFWMGVGTVSTVVSTAVNFDHKRLKQELALSKLGYKRHVIVVGGGVLGEAVIDMLKKMGEKRIVVIESNPLVVRRLKAKSCFVIEGDGGSEDVLLRARIADSRLLVVATGDDSDNILTVIKGRSLNPKIYIVARAKLSENYQKIAEYADLVVSPTLVGAALMALGETPEVSRFVHGILNLRDSQRLWEIAVPSTSITIGKTLGELQLKKRFNATLVAVRTKRDFQVNPDLTWFIKPNDVIVLLANRTSFEAARNYLENKA